MNKLTSFFSENIAAITLVTVTTLIVTILVVLLSPAIGVEAGMLVLFVVIVFDITVFINLFRRRNEVSVPDSEIHDEISTSKDIISIEKAVRNRKRKYAPRRHQKTRALSKRHLTPIEFRAISLISTMILASIAILVGIQDPVVWSFLAVILGYTFFKRE